MIQLGQDIIGGLGFGAIYALAALGLVVVFRTSQIVNFAFGALGTAVAMILWTALSMTHLPPAVCWLIAVAAALAIGAVADAALLRRIGHATPLIQITLTLGLLVAIEGLVGVVWGYPPKAIPPVISGTSLALGPYYIGPNQIAIIVLTLALAAALHFMLERTRLGLAMRAIAQDRETAMLMGVPVRGIVTLSWAWGVLLSGLAAILVAPAVSLSPTMMDQIALFAFAAAVLGGFGSLAGAIAGGFIVGIAGSLIAAYVSTNFQLTFIFLLIVAVLYARPQGLFGAEVKTRQ
jgi:branched-chain amino acid transport system permease protein